MHQSTTQTHHTLEPPSTAYENITLASWPWNASGVGMADEMHPTNADTIRTESLADAIGRSTVLTSAVTKSLDFDFQIVSPLC